MGDDSIACSFVFDIGVWFLACSVVLLFDSRASSAGSDAVVTSRLLSVGKLVVSVDSWVSSLRFAFCPAVRFVEADAALDVGRVRLAAGRGIATAKQAKLQLKR